MKKSIFYFLLILPLFSCETDDYDPITNDEDELVSEGQFTINLIEGYPFGTEESWLIIHDLEGNPIKYTAVAQGSSTQFDIDRSARYHISIFTKHSAFGSSTTLLETFTNVKATRDFTLRLNVQSGTSIEHSGIFDIKINLNDDRYSAYTSTSFNTYQSWINHLEDDIQLMTPLYPAESKYLVVARSSIGENRYTYLSSPTKDTSYPLDFKSLKPFDKVLHLDNPESNKVYFSVNALTEKDGLYLPSYLVSSNKFGGPATEIAYLDEFETYTTAVNSYPTDGSMTTKSFYKIGEAPNKIEFLSHNEIPVQRGQLTDFSMSMFPSATDHIVTFDYPNLYNYPSPPITVRWIVRGDQPTFKLDLPDEIKSLYPALSDLSKMQLESISINKSSISYDQYIIDELVERPHLKTVEISSIQQFYPKN